MQQDHSKQITGRLKQVIWLYITNTKAPHFVPGSHLCLPSLVLSSPEMHAQRRPQHNHREHSECALVYHPSLVKVHSSFCIGLLLNYHYLLLSVRKVLTKNTGEVFASTVLKSLNIFSVALQTALQ